MVAAESLYEEKLESYTTTKELMTLAAENGMLDHVQHLSTYKPELTRLYRQLEKKYIKKYGKDY